MDLLDNLVSMQQHTEPRRKGRKRTARVNQEPSLVHHPPSRLSTSDNLSLARDEDKARDGNEGEGEAEGVDLRVGVAEGELVGRGGKRRRQEGRDEEDREAYPEVVRASRVADGEVAGL